MLSARAHLRRPIVAVLTVAALGCTLSLVSTPAGAAPPAGTVFEQYAYHRTGTSVATNKTAAAEADFSDTAKFKKVTFAAASPTAADRLNGETSLAGEARATLPTYEVDAADVDDSKAVDVNSEAAADAADAANASPAANTPAKAANASEREEATTAASRIEYDYMTRDECLDHSASYTDAGWIKNHYSWCIISYGYAVARYGGSIIGTASWRNITVGQGSRQYRYVGFVENIDQVSATKALRGGFAFASAWTCEGRPTRNQCDMSGGGTRTLANGESTTFSYRVFNDEPGTKGKEKRGVTLFDIRNGLVGAAPAKLAHSGYRCDSAKYVRSGKACIFDRVLPSFTYKKSDKSVDGVAKHIDLALRHPGDTQPKVSGKKIPSRLHREYWNTTVRKKNRSTAVAMCKKVYGSKYAADKNDCDEYPFASTEEGAYNKPKAYSVKLVPNLENGKAGSKLGAWYDRDHILDHDEFEIHVK